MRVGLTRPHADSEAVAERLRALGHEGILAPVLAIVPRRVALPAEASDALLITSRHALAGLTAEQRRTLRDVPVYAVGRASGEAAREAGLRDVRVARGAVAALRDLVRLTRPAPGRFLYLAGDIRKPDLEEGLRADGHALTVVESYEAMAIAWDTATTRRLADAPPAAWLHFSARSAVRASAEATRVGLWARFAASAHLCLSREIADRLVEAGVRDPSVAEAPTLDSLLQALTARVASTGS